MDSSPASRLTVGFHRAAGSAVAPSSGNADSWDGSRMLTLGPSCWKSVFLLIPACNLPLEMALPEPSTLICTIPQLRVVCLDLWVSHI